MKVYVATAGEFDERRIVGVFVDPSRAAVASREAAETIDPAVIRGWWRRGFYGPCENTQVEEHEVIP